MLDDNDYNELTCKENTWANDKYLPYVFINYCLLMAAYIKHLSWIIWNSPFLTSHFALCEIVIPEMTVGKDQEVTVKSKGAGGQGKVAAKVTAPSGKPVASKVCRMIEFLYSNNIIFQARTCLDFYNATNILDFLHL